ncbi:MAG: D-sedoheptulose 7-phosphate isomerase [bacterium]|nr:D-sedoheptulose 7-phosphate isomerase [bacterium]
MQNEIKASLLETAKTLEETADFLAADIEKFIEMVIQCYKEDGVLYFFGNGGSAADAQHLAAEFVCRFKIDRPPMKAIALTTDTSFLTACANDYSYEEIFARQLEAFVSSKDICIGISTSGNSLNVLRGFEVARAKGAKTVAFLGGNGGKIKSAVDLALVVSSSNTPNIQATHITIGHIMCDFVERKLYRRLD